MTLIAYVGLAANVLGNGTFTMLHKHCKCANEIWICYYCLGFASGSLLTIPAILFPLGIPVVFARYGLLAGVVQFAIVQLLFPVVATAGLAVGGAMLTGGVLLLSILFDVLLKGLRPTNDLGSPNRMKT